MTDQACGCEADSGDPDYSCDCAMQGHATVQCKDIAYVVQIANVLLAFVKKPLDKCHKR
jgi:hypothetical protein